MLPEPLAQARALLDAVTPLKTDCGLTCGGACCQSLPGETTGMLLFPGEEACYIDHPDYTLTPTDHGMLLTCHGVCERGERPLSCRLFPLLPLLRADGVKIATDLRAKAVCPLARQGKSALHPDFVNTVRLVGCLLAEDPVQRAFLQQLTDTQDELKALRRQFGRDHHV